MAQNNFELQVYVARTAAELQQGGGTRLKEVPGPNAEPGTSYVQARPAGEFFALKVMNNLPAYKMAQWAKNPCVLVKVDGKQATVTLPSVKSGPTTFCGWEVDAYDRSRIKPFQVRFPPCRWWWWSPGRPGRQTDAANNTVCGHPARRRGADDRSDRGSEPGAGIIHRRGLPRGRLHALYENREGDQSHLRQAARGQGGEEVRLVHLGSVAGRNGCAEAGEDFLH